MFTVTASTLGRTGLDLLSPAGGYAYGGSELEPFRGEPSPRQIVAALHAEIAALDDERAALVAAYDELQAGLGTAGRLRRYNEQRAADWETRLRQYARLRAAGMTKRQAGQAVQVSGRTASKYEADMHLVTGGTA
jgi:hypothetical protein